MLWRGIELPQPYFHDDDVYIIKGDCQNELQQMPSSSIDFILTSPPYNKRGTSGGLVKRVTYPDKLPENEYQSRQIDILTKCYRVLSDKGALVYNHKVRYDGKAIFPVEWLLRTPFIPWQEIIWDRSITGNIRGWRYWSIDERFYWLVKSKPKELSQKHAQLTSIWRLRPENGVKDHPAPFPLQVADRFIGSLSSKNDMVLDPFLGSGTTIIAGNILQRKCIGIEISEEYCEMATLRYIKYLATREESSK